MLTTALTLATSNSSRELVNGTAMELIPLADLTKVYITKSCRLDYVLETKNNLLSKIYLVLIIIS